MTTQLDRPPVLDRPVNRPSARVESPAPARGDVPQAPRWPRLRTGDLAVRRVPAPARLLYRERRAADDRPRCTHRPMLQLVVAGYGIAYALMLVVAAASATRSAAAGCSCRRDRLHAHLAALRPGPEHRRAGRAPDPPGPVGGDEPAAGARHYPRHARRLPPGPGSRLLRLDGRRRRTVGQLFGGGLVQANLWGLSWRPIFLVNVPVGLAVLALSAPLPPGHQSPETGAVDLAGTPCSACDARPAGPADRGPAARLAGLDVAAAPLAPVAGAPASRWRADRAPVALR